ncbi:hypothetical protein [Streptomyces sp. AC495_CC817]|uniref:hypothetical protein n=1 Tax=Streptomyces sp. AC495_CC817 TaxID=2823900 RepID=UPI001C2647B0|nr:hypothetical protein [Streptomyces sp. AC495_CC817]
MTDEHSIHVGQIWRRKKNGKHIRIVRQRQDYSGSIDDWYWVGDDYKGRGVSYGSYIRRDCELVKDGESDDR